MDGTESFKEAYIFCFKDLNKYGNNIKSFFIFTLKHKFNIKLFNSWITSVFEYDFLYDFLIHLKNNKNKKEVLDSLKYTINYKYINKNILHNITIEINSIKSLYNKYNEKIFTLEQTKNILDLLIYFGLDKDIDIENFNKLNNL
jgi:hypothetical protein